MRMAVAFLPLLLLAARAAPHAYIDRTSIEVMGRLNLSAAAWRRLEACDLHVAALSRAAVDTLYFQPVSAAAKALQLPVSYSEGCPLLEGHDLFRELHGRRDAFSGMGLRCCFCGKTLSKREHMDAHLIRRHLANLSRIDRVEAPDTTCMADHCGMLLCQLQDWTFRDAFLTLPCFPAKMAQLRAQCLHMLQGPCRAGVNSSAAVDMGTVAAFDAAANETVHAVCDRLTCEHMAAVRDTPWPGWAYLRMLVAGAVLAGAALHAAPVAMRVLQRLRERWHTKPSSRFKAIQQQNYGTVRGCARRLAAMTCAECWGAAGPAGAACAHQGVLSASRNSSPARRSAITASTRGAAR